MTEYSSDIVFKRLASYGQLEEEDRFRLSKLCRRHGNCLRNSVLLDRGPQKYCIFLLNGWAKSYQILRDGDRVITSFYFPGHIFCLHTFLLGISFQSYAAASEVMYCRVAEEQMHALFEQSPALRNAILREFSWQNAMTAAHLASITRRNALSRLAHLFLEFRLQLKAANFPADNGFGCPLTQEDLADALGLTSVHVNRMIRRLKESGSMNLVNRHVTIGDLKKLQHFAQWDDSDIPEISRGALSSRHSINRSPAPASSLMGPEPGRHGASPDRFQT